MTATLLAGATAASSATADVVPTEIVAWVNLVRNGEEIDIFDMLV